MLRFIRWYADYDMDQHDHISLNSKYGPLYVDISRYPHNPEAYRYIQGF